MPPRIVNLNPGFTGQAPQVKDPRSILARLLLQRGSQLGNTSGAGIRSAGESIAGALLQKSIFNEQQTKNITRSEQLAQFLSPREQAAQNPEGFAVDLDTSQGEFPPVEAGSGTPQGLSPQQQQLAQLLRNMPGLGQQLAAQQLGRQFTPEEFGGSRPFEGIGSAGEPRLFQQGSQGGIRQTGVSPIPPVAKPQETFEPVFDTDGKVVAQRSTLTKKIIRDPRVSGADASGRPLFSKAPGVITEKGGKFFQSIPVLNNRTGTIEEVEVEITGDPVSRLGESGEQLTQRKIREAIAKKKGEIGEEIKGAEPKAAATVRGKEIETRLQDTIGEGLSQAPAIPILTRSIELLASIKTGGFEGAKLKAKEVFGIESANEGELSANLGKAVLSQLRTTFGAQFTEREGALLRNIEAGIGKSTAANIRLLTQARKIVMVAVNRGIRNAVAAGDFRTAADIKEAMSLDLSIATPATQTAPTLSPNIGEPVPRSFSEDIENLSNEAFIKKYLGGN